MTFRSRKNHQVLAFSCQNLCSFVIQKELNILLNKKEHNLNISFFDFGSKPHLLGCHSRRTLNNVVMADTREL